MQHEAQREDGFPVFYADSNDSWRNYLEVHHASTKNVWLILYKKNSGIPSLTYSEAVDEALCFGWVDSKPNKRDEKSYYQFFAKRNPKSNWSRVNKEKIARLAAAGKLAPAGEAMVKLAQDNGTWDALNDVEDLVIPKDMLELFQQYPPIARENWDNFPRSVKRGVLEWIFNAKRPATRTKRITETVENASRGERVNQWR